MSAALIWHLVRDNNSFLVKRGRTDRDGSVQFSTEPGNVMGVNTFKYSGLANERTINVASDLTLSTKVIFTNPFKSEFGNSFLLNKFIFRTTSF